jgi:hypothetical protein
MLAAYGIFFRFVKQAVEPKLVLYLVKLSIRRIRLKLNSSVKMIFQNQIVRFNK